MSNFTPQTNLTFPLSNTDIIPALTCRALDSFPSSAEILASMSLRISAMPVCSGSVGHPRDPLYDLLGSVWNFTIWGSAHAYCFLDEKLAKASLITKPMPATATETIAPPIGSSISFIFLSWFARWKGQYSCPSSAWLGQGFPSGSFSLQGFMVKLLREVQSL